MRTASKRRRIPTADEIAEEAMAGKDISKHFTGTGRMVRPGEWEMQRALERDDQKGFVTELIRAVELRGGSVPKTLNYRNLRIDLFFKLVRDLGLQLKLAPVKIQKKKKR